MRVKDANGLICKQNVNTRIKLEYEKLFELEVADFVKRNGGTNAVKRIVEHVEHMQIATFREKFDKLNRVKTFVNKLGNSSEYYFEIVENTGNLGGMLHDHLISNNVSEFARKLGRSSVYYFSALNKTGRIETLTDDNIINNAVVEFALSLKDSALYYFDTAGRSPEVRSVLTGKQMMNREMAQFIRDIGDSSREFFDTIWLTNSLGVFTESSVIDFVTKLSSDTSKKAFFKHASRMKNDEILSIVELCNRVNDSALLRENSDTIRGVLNLPERIKKLIVNEKTLNMAIVYLLSDKKLPEPSADNMFSYYGMVAKYIRDNYGIENILNDDQIHMLFSIRSTSRVRFAQIINNSSEKGRREYVLTTNTEYMLSKYNTDQLMEYAVRSLLDVDRADAEARDAVLEIVGSKIFNKAVYEFYSGKWNDARRKIRKIMDEEGAVAAYKQIVKSYSKNESVNRFVETLFGKQREELHGTLSSVVDNNPLNFDNRVLGACIFLPFGAVRESLTYYVTDPRAVLVRYDVNGVTNGVAVSVMDDDTLFVNSVEGSHSFRGDHIFYNVLRDIVERAKDIHAKRVVFFGDPSNPTPKKFVEFLEKSKEARFEDRLTVSLRGFEGHTDLESRHFEGYVIDIEPYLLMRE